MPQQRVSNQSDTATVQLFGSRAMTPGQAPDPRENVHASADSSRAALRHKNMAPRSSTVQDRHQGKPVFTTHQMISGGIALLLFVLACWMWYLLVREEMPICSKSKRRLANERTPLTGCGTGQCPRSSSIKRSASFGGALTDPATYKARKSPLYGLWKGLVREHNSANRSAATA